MTRLPKTWTCAGSLRRGRVLLVLGALAIVPALAAQTPGSAVAGVVFGRTIYPDLRGRAVPRLPHRRRRGLGDAAAVSGCERQPGRHRGVRVDARRARRSRRSFAIAPAQQADQSRAAYRRRPHPARFVRGRSAARLGAPPRRAFPRTRWRRRASAWPPSGTRSAPEPAPAPADAQPIQQHRSRSARRLQPPGRSFSARGFRQRVQESAAHAGDAAARGRRLQRRGREAGAECVSRRRRQRARAVQAGIGARRQVSRSVRPRASGCARFAAR